MTTEERISLAVEVLARLLEELASNYGQLPSGVGSELLDQLEPASKE